VTYDILLIVHFFGLGAGLAMFSLGIATRDLGPEERGKFMARVSILRKNGSYGLLLLIASGLGFIVERGWGSVAFRGGGMFHAKLTLVAVMVGLLGYSQLLAKKAMAPGGGALMPRLMLVSRAMLVTGLLVVVVAVLAFH
jgi:hypothetical protein